MKNRTLYFVRVLALVMVAGALAVSPLRAGLLGATLNWQYYAYGGPYGTGGTWVDNGGIGGTFKDSGATYFNIIADNDTITFDYSVATKSGTWSTSSLSLPPTIYNGIAINLVSGPAFTSVSIDAATNMPGFDAADLSFTGSQIQVNWENLPFGPSTIVKLDVGTSGTPEPGAWVLIGSGLSVLGLAIRRSRRATAMPQ
jgi:hypothetical protein